jgi:COMPASS component SWD3
MSYSLVNQDHAAVNISGGKLSSRPVDLEEPQVKEEILLLIANYLMENGYSASSHTLLDEAALKVRALSKDRSTFRSMSKAVVAGNWTEVETLLKQVSTANQGPKMKGLRYSVYRQQFLEMVDKGESQKAFTYLLGNLKPMPNISSEDLHALTVMLTCRNVAESDPSWPGVAASREALANQVLSLGVADLVTADAPPDITQIVPPRRLNVLLEQAVMYQRSHSDTGSSMNLPCRSLLRDYEATGRRDLFGRFVIHLFYPALQVLQLTVSAA